ncbi:MAG: stalk domain-containing protein [Lutispora sp.]|nr:stalk domain-containing protein [Lutispora sp.]MDD4835227.1 stalk domain-containing protein [Lutispora sp.]
MISKNFAKGIALITLLLFIGVNYTSVIAENNPVSSVVSSPTIVGTAEASFSLPYGLAYSKKLDALIIADTQNHRICSLNLKTLKVGTISGISKGADRFGFPGGGYIDGDISKAMFNHPRGVAVADNGAILIADTGNHAIRQIYEGKVTTIAGGKIAGYHDGRGTKASFLSPSGVAIDGQGNIFVADTLNNVIRKIDINANVTTYAGKTNDKSLLNEPVGLVFDKDGNLYVADGGNHQIKKIPSKDKIEIVAGIHSVKDKESGYWAGGYMNGPTEVSYFNFPKGVAVKDDGTIFVADSYNHAVRAIKNSQVYTVAGAGIAGEILDDSYISYFDGPTGIAYAKETLFIADHWNNRIVIIPDKDKYVSSIYTYSGEQAEGEIFVFLEGREIIFPDVYPFILDGQVKIPIRALAEAWGAEVLWNQEKKVVTVLREGESVEFSLESGDLLIYQGRSMVGLEILKEKLGFDVKWLDKQKIISIQSK